LTIKQNRWIDPQNPRFQGLTIAICLSQAVDRKSLRR
jgi:hypothetical protein